MKKIIWFLLAILVCCAPLGCSTKKTIENTKHEEKTNTAVETTDTADEKETIIITETRINDSTKQKTIEINRRKINHGKQQIKSRHKETDSILSQNTTKMAADKQQIKDLKKQNKDLKKVATGKTSLDRLSELVLRVSIIVIVALVTLRIIKRVNS